MDNLFLNGTQKITSLTFRISKSKKIIHLNSILIEQYINCQKFENFNNIFPLFS